MSCWYNHNKTKHNINLFIFDGMYSSNVFNVVYGTRMGVEQTSIDVCENQLTWYVFVKVKIKFVIKQV